ncbi:hypothetical protein ACWGN5_17450 [Streptomyces sp. NPDC055815]
MLRIAAALGVPATRLVAEREQVMAVQRADEVVWEQCDKYEARFPDHIDGSGVIENYVVRISADAAGSKVSEPHPVGTLEHLYVTSGQVRVGPVDSPVELSTGDFARYPGALVCRRRSPDRVGRPAVRQAAGGPPRSDAAMCRGRAEATVRAAS